MFWGAFVSVEHLWNWMLIMRLLFLDPQFLLLLAVLLLLSFCWYNADNLVVIYTNFSLAAVGAWNS
jgi:hypothetical protein